MSCPNCGYPVEAGARFCPNCGTPQPGQESTAAEFRQLTVLFADLVGSTALAQRLDPETYREVISDYHRICSDRVESFGGYVGQLLGDGVLCYFGYPVAHEEDAEAAIRASLAIQDALPDYQSPTGQAVEARIGIHTGKVVIGDQAGSRQDILALGDATNVAARVQGAAEPGAVLITDETLRLVAGLFVTTSMGLHELKGIEGSIELHRIERASGVRGRLEIATDLAPLSGRSEELSELVGLWADARKGSGRLIGVEGEAGVGKSRLVHEFRNRLAAESYTFLDGQCSPFRTASAFYPIVEMVESGLGLESIAESKGKLEKLEEGLAIPGIDPHGVLPYLLTVLGLPQSARYPLPDLSPDLSREKTFGALCTMLRALGELQPVLIAIEDVHWADRSTLDYLRYLSSRTADMSALVVLTWRPSGAPQFAIDANVPRIPVERLDSDRAMSLARQVAEDAPDDVLRQIVERADGVPLFIEELARWLDTGSDSEIPMTLQDSLTARLDRLGEAKQLARIGATLGREFSRPILEAVSDWDSARIETSIDSLTQAGILSRTGRGRDTKYAFRHALIQEAAYESQLRKDRRALHRVIAETIEKDFRTVSLTQPELLAVHWDRAGVAQKAAPLYIAAGEQALDRLANHEAVDHFNKALELIDQMDASESREELEIEARLLAGQPMAAVHGFGTPLVTANYDRLNEIADHLGTGLDSLPIRMALASYYAASASFDKMRSTGRDVLELAKLAQLPMLEAAGHTLIGIASSTVGTHAEANDSLQTALAILAEEPDAGPASPTDPDLEILARGTLGFVQLGMGQIAESRFQSESALARADKLDHTMSRCIAAVLAGMLARLRGDVEASAVHAAKTIDVAGRAGYPFWLSQGEVIAAWAAAMRGEDSADALTDGLQRHLDSGSETTVPAMYWVAAEGMRVMGRHSEALDMLARGEEVIARTGEIGYLMSFAVVRAQVMIDQETDLDEAERLLVQAIADSRNQERAWNDYQASLTLADLYQSRSRHDLAVAALESLEKRWEPTVDEEMNELIAGALTSARTGAPT